MFLAAAPSPKISIAHKTISIPLAFLFTRTCRTPSEQREQTRKHVSQQREDSIGITDRSYWTKKIHRLCAEDSNVDEALCLLDRLSLRGYRPDSLNLSSILHALCDSHRFYEAHHRLLLSIASNCVPDERTCNVLVARLLDSRNPYSTLHVVRRLFDVKPEFVPSLVIYNRLMNQLCSFSRPNEAHALFFDMKSRGHCPNVFSYTTLINGYCRIGEVGHAQKVFAEMRDDGVLPNSLTYSVLIGGVLQRRDIERGRELMCELWEKMRDEEDLSVRNAAFANLVDSLCKEGFFHELFSVSEHMPQGKSVSEEFVYNQMIDSLCKAGRYHGASRIVYVMRKRGFLPSLVSYNHIIHGLCKEGGCMRAYQLLEEGIGFGYLPSEYTYKVLVEGLCKESELHKARKVLQYMLNKEGVVLPRMFNIYLRALVLLNNPTELLNLLVFMLQKQCQPDVITLNTAINGFCKMGRIEEALKVLNDMIIGKFCSPDAVTFTTIICGLLDVGRTQEAFGVLHHIMPKHGVRPGIVTYNAVLRGLFKLRQGNEAMEVFNSMVSDGVVADSTTYTIVIEGLCESGQIEEAQRFWDDVIWPSKIHDNFVYAALLKGLCRSGKLNEACHFLYELVDSGVSPNIFNYNILIDNACKLGLKREAYQIMGEMRRNGVAPDAVTWRILDKLHGNVRRQLFVEGATLPSRDGLHNLGREEKLRDLKHI
ncbi:pentatricopeptide repeat-containing protein At3g18020 isoform X1 [Juglans microcarpa x Juglans regia]|uniref:pentatricopeptide repeat-containing protein At3g18020 isoform X1 n=1 Tax=Juglans microcarpa x Juglans regia TaxID=2249226 RepID=UPI001B7F1622|nr:pentatricopeptide repeat-containing protein At3g18020 isoform X1 [Juglans microcarpa x Juglans regia]XP_040997737.1 pentatricopeptide repeat-containing protein At3g18020 isoform X1 [Juglans microcarpa x Juglans regia]